jgi:CMP-N,N'-diacetyllegionaminic acid synthase
MANVLGVIPARAGSKGIPNKNLALLGGRPLLAYTADAVKASTKLTRTIVSTDDERVTDCAKLLGLAVLTRPAALAADDTPMLPVLQHAIAAMRSDGFNADIVVLLQPTSPLRRAEHIDAAIEWLERTRGDSVVSVVAVPHQFNPTSVMRLDEGRLKPFLDGPTATRRQDKPPAYARNGPAVLAVHARVIESGSLYGNETWPLVMGPEESIDIDTPDDLRFGEYLIARVRHSPDRP